MMLLYFKEMVVMQNVGLVYDFMLYANKDVEYANDVSDEDEESRGMLYNDREDVLVNSINLYTKISFNPEWLSRDLILDIIEKYVKDHNKNCELNETLEFNREDYENGKKEVENEFIPTEEYLIESFEAVAKEKSDLKKDTIAPESMQSEDSQEKINFDELDPNTQVNNQIQVNNSIDEMPPNASENFLTMSSEESTSFFENLRNTFIVRKINELIEKIKEIPSKAKNLKATNDLKKVQKDINNKFHETKNDLFTIKEIYKKLSENPNAQIDIGPLLDITKKEPGNAPMTFIRLKLESNEDLPNLLNELYKALLKIFKNYCNSQVEIFGLKYGINFKDDLNNENLNKQFSKKQVSRINYLKTYKAQNEAAIDVATEQINIKEAIENNENKNKNKNKSDESKPINKIKPLRFKHKADELAI